MYKNLKHDNNLNDVKSFAHPIVNVWVCMCVFACLNERTMKSQVYIPMQI